MTADDDDLMVGDDGAVPWSSFRCHNINSNHLSALDY